jgi:hypothetical protein
MHQYRATSPSGAVSAEYCTGTVDASVCLELAPRRRDAGDGTGSQCRCFSPLPSTSVVKLTRQQQQTDLTFSPTDSQARSPKILIEKNVIFPCRWHFLFVHTMSITYQPSHYSQVSRRSAIACMWMCLKDGANCFVDLLGEKASRTSVDSSPVELNHRPVAPCLCRPGRVRHRGCSVAHTGPCMFLLFGQIISLHEYVWARIH